MWGCHTSRKPGVRAWACQNGSSDEYLSMGLFFQVCFRVPRVSFSPAPDTIASLTPASDPQQFGCSSCLSAPGSLPLASGLCGWLPSIRAANGSCFPLPSSHSALARLYYLFKPDPPGSQISGIMHCEPTWNELRRKLLVSVTCKTTASPLFTFESKHCLGLGISLVGN